MVATVVTKCGSILALSVYAVLPAEHAMAASYFCVPEAIDIGSYRPDDASNEQRISVQLPEKTPFWFDDQTGDYVSYADGAVGSIEPHRLRMPLAWPPSGKGLETQVAVTFNAGQCLPSQLGVVPLSHKVAP